MYEIDRSLLEQIDKLELSERNKAWRKAMKAARRKIEEAVKNGGQEITAFLWYGEGTGEDECCRENAAALECPGLNHRIGSTFHVGERRGMGRSDGRLPRECSGSRDEHCR